MKLNIIRNNVLNTALLLGATMLFAACQREQLAGFGEQNTTTRFEVSVAGISDVNDTPDTKANISDYYIASEGNEDGYELPLSCKIMSGIVLGSAETTVATKATLYNTTGDNTHKLSEYLTEFQVAAWEGTSGTTNFIPAGTKVKYFTTGESEDRSFWSTVNDSGTAVEYIWKKSATTKTFFAWANLPASGASVTCAGAANQTLTLTTLPDKDILMGFYQGDGATGSPAVKTGTAGIHFYHPMTAVRFKKGTLSDAVSISGISIEGVYTSGKTTQTPSTGTAFAWTKTDGSAFTATDETGTVSLSDVTVDDDGFIGDAIVLIPQTFSIDSKTRIKVVLNDGSSDIPLYYPLTSGSWAAGHTYTYTLSVPENLEVKVADEVNGALKSNVKISNTGNIPGYIRVAIVSNWICTIDGEQVVIKSCDISSEGTLFGLGSDWIKGVDGYYYYKYGVGVGATTKQDIFTSYTAADAPADGAILEMDIMAQIVKSRSAWGSELPEGLSEEVEK